MLLTAGSVWAFQKPAQAPLSDLDKRSKSSPTLEQLAAAQALTEAIPGVRVDFDPVSCSPKMISVPSALLVAPQPQVAGQTQAAPDPYAPIRSFLREHQALFGYGPAILNTTSVRREFTTPHNQMRTTVWDQQVGGIPILDATLIAHATASRHLVNLSSQLIPEPAQAADAGTPGWPDLIAAPPLPPSRAVAIAARSIGVNLPEAQFAPTDSGAGVSNGRLRFAGPGIKGPAECQLRWVAANKQSLRLCWDIVLTSRARSEMFRVLVDVQDREVLVRQCLTSYAADASYRVFTSDSPSPLSPGHAIPSSVQPPILARSLLTLAALDTNASPQGWIPASGNDTVGNNAAAHTDREDDDQPDLPRPAGSPARVFDFGLDLTTQEPSSYEAASVVQLFYLCNWMHDKLYALGFTEAAGNFQMDNFGRGGEGNDPVQADAQDGGGLNNANFATPPDGMLPRMQMYVFESPLLRRDGALDSEIVLHEYTHGLSNRRVGGGAGLVSVQARGLGEGWSDFFPLALLSEAGDDLGGNYAIGAYVSLQPAFQENYYYGFRRYPYSTNLLKNPLTFADLDPSQANNCTSAAPHNPAAGSCSYQEPAEVHNQGEVWCAILWEARANVIAKHGWETGNQLMLQLVCDGLNLTPPNPNFVQARDAILQADVVNNGGANLVELWAGFAKRGLGASATSPESTTTSGVVEAFDLPDLLRISPEGQIVAKGPVGGPFNLTSALYDLTTSGTNGLNWAAAVTSDWLTLSQNSGLLEPAAAPTVLTAMLSSATSLLPAAAHTNWIWFTNLDSGITQARRVVLLVGQPDYFSRFFDGLTPSELSSNTFTFTPNGSPSFYSVCREPANAYPTSPAGGTPVTLYDDTAVAVPLSGTNSVAVYSRRSSVFHIGSNGYLTLDGADAEFDPSYQNHFKRARVAALFDDLNPSAMGSVSWLELSNRVAVTFEGVPEFGSSTRTNSFQFELFYDGTIRLTFLEIKSQRSLCGLSEGYGVPAGFYPSDFIAYEGCGQKLQLFLPASVGEASGLLTGACEVRLPVPAPENIEVFLASSDTNVVQVSMSIVIPQGQTNGFADLVIIDDQLLEPAQAITISAVSAAFAPEEAGLIVADDETADLTLELPLLIAEDAPSSPARIFASAPPAGDISIHLAASESLQLILPPSVLLPAGQTSAVFNVQALDNDAVDGTRNVEVSASVPNWTGAPASLLISDNENTNLSVILPASLNEASGVLSEVCRVQLSGRTLSNLTVTLSCSNPDRLSASPFIVIPAGQSQSSFTLTAIDNSLPDGDTWISLSAEAPGFSPGSGSVLVRDDEVAPAVTIAPTLLSLTVGGSGTFTAHAQGAKPISYQWHFEGAALPGATDLSYFVSGAHPTNAGAYTVVASNLYGATTSSVATLQVTPALDLNQALDQPGWVWETGGASPWLPQTNVTFDGMDAARSGPITHLQETWIQVTNVPGPGTLRFWWKISSENAYDTLTFAVDGTSKETASGEVDWQQKSVVLGSGLHTLRWAYTKDGSVSAGQDRAWLDQMELTLDDLAPVMVEQPGNIVTLLQQPATLCARAAGQEPLAYQWRFADADLPGATSPCLSLPSVQLAQQGQYQVVVTNSHGSVTSAPVTLTVLNIQPFDFQIGSLQDFPVVLLEQDHITGDDRGGIAVSQTNLFYTGDNFTGLFPAATLAEGTALAQRFDAIFSDLLTGRIYTLANGGSPLMGAGLATTLLEISPVTGELIGSPIPLSKPLSLPGDNLTGIFAGPGCVLLHNGSRVYCVWLPWGAVTDLGPMSALTHNSTENWAYWGVAEHFNDSFHLVYVENSQTIARTRVSNGARTVVKSFTNLSDMASITVSPWLNRWFFHFEGESQFGGVFETVGSAPATLASGFKMAPPIVEGDDILLSFPTICGRVTYVDVKNSLDETAWTPLDSVAGDGTIRMLTNSVSGAPQRFYRVRLE